MQHFTAKVERGDIHDVVDATGTINAVTTVQVGSQVSGQIAKLNADFNSRVHKGDIVALIDPALFKARSDQATADLESAKANVGRGPGRPRKGEGDAGADQEPITRRYVCPSMARLRSQQQPRSTQSERTMSAKASVDGAAAARGPRRRPKSSQKQAAVDGGADQPRLHRDPLADRRHCRRAQRGRRARPLPPRCRRRRSSPSPRI